jgi:hypothetical protein
MARCAGNKGDGSRCTTIVHGGQQYCYWHDPNRAGERSRNASKGGKARASREVAGLKGEVRAVIAKVESGELDRNAAAVMLQGYRTLRDFIELERRVKETDQLAAEIEELREELRHEPQTA